MDWNSVFLRPTKHDSFLRSGRDADAGDAAGGGVQQHRSVGPANRMVFKTQRLQVGRGEKVAAIQHQRAEHGVTNTLPVEMAKFIPFGEDQQGIRALGRLVGIATANEAGISSARVRDRLRVISANTRASGRQALVELDGGRAADIVGTGFVRETQQSDVLVLEHPEGPLRFVEKGIDPLAIYVFSGLKDSCIHALFFNQPAKSAKVFGQAVAAKSDPGLEEGYPDAWIEADGVSHFLNIRAKPFAEVRKHIGIGNLYAQESI